MKTSKILHEFHRFVVGFNGSHEYALVIGSVIFDCFDFGGFDSHLKTALIGINSFQRIQAVLEYQVALIEQMD